MDLDRSTVTLDADWCRELVSGTAYFLVSYFEPGANIPIVDTYVYLGRSAYEQDGESAYIFQNASSFMELGDYANLDESSHPESSIDHLLSFSADSVVGVADIDGLMVLISGLAKRMKLGIGWDRVLPDGA